MQRPRRTLSRLGSGVQVRGGGGRSKRDVSLGGLAAVRQFRASTPCHGRDPGPEGEHARRGGRGSCPRDCRAAADPATPAGGARVLGVGPKDMTDRALRQHARLAGLETESEAHEFYRELRAGLIERRRLEWLAYLGDPLVCEALERERPQGEEVAEWIQGLSRWGRTPCARAVLALVEARVLPPRRAPHADWVDAIRSWVACPCAAHASSSGVPLLQVRGRRRIGRVTWQLVAPTFSRRSRSRTAPHRVLQRRVTQALLPWAFAESRV